MVPDGPSSHGLYGKVIYGERKSGSDADGLVQVLLGLTKAMLGAECNNSLHHCTYSTRTQ